MIDPAPIGLFGSYFFLYINARLFCVSIGRGGLFGLKFYEFSSNRPLLYLLFQFLLYLCNSVQQGELRLQTLGKLEK